MQADTESDRQLCIVTGAPCKTSNHVCTEEVHYVLFEGNNVPFKGNVMGLPGSTGKQKFNCSMFGGSGQDKSKLKVYIVPYVTDHLRFQHI